jgi:hypothetical protein
MDLASQVHRDDEVGDFQIRSGELPAQNWRDLEGQDLILAGREPCRISRLRQPDHQVLVLRL